MPQNVDRRLLALQVIEPSQQRKPLVVDRSDSMRRFTMEEGVKIDLMLVVVKAETTFKIVAGRLLRPGRVRLPRTPAKGLLNSRKSCDAVSPSRLVREFLL